MNNTNIPIIEATYSQSSEEFHDMWMNQFKLLKAHEKKRPLSFILLACVLLLVSVGSLSISCFNPHSSLGALSTITFIVAIVILVINGVSLYFFYRKRAGLRKKIEYIYERATSDLNFKFTIYKDGIEETSTLQEGRFPWNSFRSIRLNRHFLYLRFKTRIKKDSNYEIGDILIPLRDVEAKYALYELLYKEAIGRGVRVFFDHY